MVFTGVEDTGYGMDGNELNLVCLHNTPRKVTFWSLEFRSGKSGLEQNKLHDIEFTSFVPSPSSFLISDAPLCNLERQSYTVVL